MWKSYLFPKFPKVGDTPPTLDAIERENPKSAMVFLWITFLVTFLFVIILQEMFVSVILSFISLCCFVLFLRATTERENFQPINEKCTSREWTCSDVAKFFKNHPSFSEYYEAVLRQGRPFYVGEMNALLERSREMRKTHDCKSLYRVIG